MSLGVRGMAGGGKGYMSFTKQFSNSSEGAGPYTFSYDIEEVHHVTMIAKYVNLENPLTINGAWVWAIICDVDNNKVSTDYLSSSSNSSTTQHRQTRMDGTYKVNKTASWAVDTYAAQVSVNSSAKTITITLGSNTPSFIYNGLKSGADYYEYLITVC